MFFQIEVTDSNLGNMPELDALPVEPEASCPGLLQNGVSVI